MSARLEDEEAVALLDGCGRLFTYALVVFVLAGGITLMGAFA